MEGPGGCTAELGSVGEKQSGRSPPGNRETRRATKAFLTMAPNSSFVAAAADTAAAHELSRNAANSQSPREEPPEVVRVARRKGFWDHRDAQISG